MFGQNYLATQIAFLKDKLSKMVGGYFGMKNGYPSVFIIQDPYDPLVSRNHYKVYRETSKNGIIYTQLVNDYIKVKNDLDFLIGEWNKTFGHKLPAVELPVNSINGVHNMDFKFFQDAEPYQNPMEYTNKHYFNGDVFRSKNEVFLAQQLTAMRIPFKVEPKVVMYPNTFNSEYVYPDFLIGVEAANKSTYIEICGAIGTDNYSYRNKAKIVNYVENGYRDMKDIMLLFIEKDADVNYMFSMLKTLLDIIVTNRS